MAIRLENISIRFRNAQDYTLYNIDANIESGSFVCILGASGCGKTTLLNVVAGLERPTVGRILVDEKEIEGPGSDRVVMFQESALFPWLNIWNNVKFGMNAAKIPRKEQDEKAAEYLNMVDLYDYRNYRVHEISGGMRQRVALARALALGSDILLMDEPFSALDEQNKRMLQEELLKIWQVTGKTILFVTHNVEEALAMAQTIIVMKPNPGQIAQRIDIDRGGETSSILKNRVSLAKAAVIIRKTISAGGDTISRHEVNPLEYQMG